jgi:hypothetical protein
MVVVASLIAEKQKYRFRMMYARPCTPTTTILFAVFNEQKDMQQEMVHKTSTFTHFAVCQSAE